MKIKKIALIFVIIMSIAGAAYCEEYKEESIIGEAIDEAMDPFKKIITPSQRLDPIVITPSRYEESSLDVSRNVTVIDDKEIGEENARYVPELLKSKAGIDVRDWMGNGKTVNVDIRGFGERAESNTLVLINGRRTNQIDMSGADWTQISIDSIETIEIVRGSGSVLYGDNAAGGVINIITKSGAGKKPEIGFKYQTGSYRYNSYSGYVEGGNKFLDYYGDLSQSDTDGYRTNSDLEADDMYGNITIKPTDTVKIRLEGAYHKDWYGQPGALMPADLDLVGWRGTIFPNSRAKTEDAYIMASPEVKADTDFGVIAFSGDIIGRGRRTASLSYFTGGFISEMNNHIRTFGVTPKVAFTTDIFDVHNRMIVGLDYYGNNDSILSTNFGGGKDLIVIDKDTVGLYATDTVTLLKKIIVNGGFRAEWASYKFDQQAVVSGVNRRNPFEYAVDAGIDYKYNEKSAIYANYSRSFRFPLTDEWYSSQWLAGGIVQGGLNLDLRPQFSNNYEIGIKENSSKYLGVKADYFVIDTRHEILYNPILFANALYDHTMRQGLELEVHAYLFDGFDSFINYTYEKAYFVGGTFAGNDIPIVPNNKLSWGLNYTFKDCFNINYTFNFVGSRRFISDQLNTMPPLKSYVTNNIKFSYYKYGLKVYAAIYNIFDEKYCEYGTLNSALTSPAYYPSPGANYVIGIEYKF